MHGERGAMDGMAVQNRVDLRPCREDIPVQPPFAGGAPGALVLPSKSISTMSAGVIAS